MDFSGPGDLVLLRKLRADNRPLILPRGAFAWRDSSTYHLDLRLNSALRPQVRHHLQRTERKLKREVGELQLVEVGDEDKEKWLEEWAHHMQVRYPKAPLLSARHLPIVTKWLLGASLDPWIKLFVLRAGCRPLAWALCYEWRNVFYLFSPIMSSDPNLAKYGPGKLLTHHLICRARARGLLTFDFLQGQHDYKLQWQPQEVPLMSCFVPLNRRGALATRLFSLRKC